MNLRYWQLAATVMRRLHGPNAVFEYDFNSPHEVRIFYWNDYMGKRIGRLWLLWDTALREES